MLNVFIVADNKNDRGHIGKAKFVTENSDRRTILVVKNCFFFFFFKICT